MDPVDGNAIAGGLFQHFGAEMTTARGSCTYCGAFALVAELRVYVRAPGQVGRCPSCGNAVLVLVRVNDVLRVDHRHFVLPE